jgi:hypothetical protein
VYVLTEHATGTFETGLASTVLLALPTEQVSLVGLVCIVHASNTTAKQSNGTI